MHSLDLGLIGNGGVAALIDANAEIQWACFPRFDGDAMFCSLLRERGTDADAGDFGFFAIDLVDLARTEQEYIANTAVLVTRLYDRAHGCIEVTDFAPRFRQHGRMFQPMLFVRRLRRVAGSPRVVLRVRPAHGYGEARTTITRGSNHIRYVAPDIALRLTTDISITAIIEELPLLVQDSHTILLGVDETVQGAIAETGRRFLEETVDHWREWVRSLNVPFEWQEAVIRAAITLQLNAYDDTGAIIAALTTSIPEMPDSTRNWDYRFCWLRDAYFVISALNRLGATRTMENYLGYILNIASSTPDGRLQPVYAIDGRTKIDEREVPALPGYRGMGPVRVGNQAFEQIQHDVYGSAVLAATHVFFDKRLVRSGDEILFQRLEALGERAVLMHAEPDAGIWEFRGTQRVHTFSAVMCWAACDRLARIARQLGLDARADYWRTTAARIHETICSRAWDPGRNAFGATFGANGVDASLLLLHEVGFLAADDPRFAGTVAAIERELKVGDFIFRYNERDDFGVPANAFTVCTYWYIDALSALGRKAEARALFEKLLAMRNRHGLLAEHIDPRTGEQWGNFVQTYSMVGLITAALRLSISWDEAF